MLSKTRILVVDDSLFMRSVLKDILMKNGYDVIAEASNGQEAIELFQKHLPDVITMDITMPEMDGLEALASIIKIDPDACVVMCSAMGQQGIVMDAIRKGARDFIIKPFQPARVVEAIQKSMRSPSLKKS